MWALFFVIKNGITFKATKKFSEGQIRSFHLWEKDVQSNFNLSEFFGLRFLWEMSKKTALGSGYLFKVLFEI